MILWWIGNIVLLVVIVPVVVILLNRLIAPVREIRETADGLAARGASLVSLLDAVNDLPRTQNLVHQTSAGLARYGAALDRIL